MTLEQSASTFLFLSGYDAVMGKKIPPVNDLLGNGVTAIGYEYLTKPILEMVNKRFFQQQNSNMMCILRKMIGVGLTDGLQSQFLMGKAPMWNKILMKSIVAVGAESVFRNY